MSHKHLAALILAGIALIACQPAPAAPQKPAIHAAYPSEADLTDIPSLMALDLLREQGYEVTETFFADTQLAVEAVSRGDAQFGAGSVEPNWSAIQQGANIVTIMEQVRNTWTLASLNEIEQCSDIDGKRLALTSEGSGSAALTRAYIAQNCPGTETDIVLISGSQNRAAALIAGQIDVTPLELVDVLRLEKESPDQFRVLVTFADALPDMMVTGIYANRDFAESNHEAVQDYLQALITVHQQIKDNSDLFVQKAVEVMKVDAAEISPIIDAHLAFDAWPTDGGLTEERIENGLAFYANTGDLEAGLTARDVANWDYLQAVLDTP